MAAPSYRAKYIAKYGSGGNPPAGITIAAQNGFPGVTYTGLHRAANIDFVLSTIDTAGADYMPLSGGTFTGNVSMGNYILTVPTPDLP